MLVSEGLSQVLAETRDELHARANVVATGIGYKVSDGIRTGEIGIICSVTEKMPATALSAPDLIPEQLGGFSTDVVATGPFRALALPTERWRPAAGGVSIGHASVTAGTLGCLVHRGDETFILSNNHVLADCNAATPGDAILQPGPIDGGTPADRIATLERFVPLVMAGEQDSTCAFAGVVTSALNVLARVSGSHTRVRAVSQRSGTNLIDAAIARPDDLSLVSTEILGIGAIAGVARAGLGDVVRKSGRTTGLTAGEIEQIDVTVDVGYGTGRVARFADQLLAGRMSQGGDSGSAVVDSDGNIVGLLFAGSESTTLINRIENVFAGLDVGL